MSAFVITILVRSPDASLDSKAFKATRFAIILHAGVFIAIYAPASLSLFVIFGSIAFNFLVTRLFEKMGHMN